MPQITVLDKDNRILDKLPVSTELFSNLKSYKTTHSLSYITFPELKAAKFALEIIVAFHYGLDMKTSVSLETTETQCSKLLHFLILNRYPWYGELSSLLNAIDRLNTQAAKAKIRIIG